MLKENILNSNSIELLFIFLLTNTTLSDIMYLDMLVLIIMEVFTSVKSGGPYHKWELLKR